MSAREFIRHNFWLKLFALLLATLTWFTVRFAIHQEKGFEWFAKPALATNTWTRIPIVVLDDPAHPRAYQLNPNEAKVIAVGDPQRLQSLTRKDFTLYVDLTTPEAAKSPIKIIGVISPAGIDQVTIVPYATRIVEGSTP